MITMMMTVLNNNGDYNDNDDENHGDKGDDNDDAVSYTHLRAHET